MSDIKRRTFLKGSLLTALAVAFAEGATWPMTRPPLARAQTPAPGNTFTAPYSVVTSSALSQDYFDTGAVLMDAATDTVAPFLLGGQVVALVLSGSSGALSLLAPDSTQSSGWSLTAVPDPADPTGQTPLLNVQSVAVSSQIYMGGGPLALVILSPDNDGSLNDQPTVAWWGYEGTAGSWQGPVSETLDASVGPVTAATDANGNAYFYAFNDDGSGYLWSVTSGTQYIPITHLQGQNLSNPIMVWNPDYFGDNPDDPSVPGYIYSVDSNGQNFMAYQQTGQYDFNPGGLAQVGQSVLFAGWSTVDPRRSSRRCGRTWPATSSTLAGQSNGGQPTPLANFTTIIGPDQLVAWLTPEGLASFAVLAPDPVTPTTTVLSMITGTVTAGVPYVHLADPGREHLSGDLRVGD